MGGRDGRLAALGGRDGRLAEMATRDDRLAEMGGWDSLVCFSLATPFFPVLLSARSRGKWYYTNPEALPNPGDTIIAPPSFESKITIKSKHRGGPFRVPFHDAPPALQLLLIAPGTSFQSVQELYLIERVV